MVRDAREGSTAISSAAAIALASALFAANIPCDSGEDVDRLIRELNARGYGLAAQPTPTLDAERLARAIREHNTDHWQAGSNDHCSDYCVDDLAARLSNVTAPEPES